MAEIKDSDEANYGFKSDTRPDKNQVVNQIKESQEKVQQIEEIPPGYITIELSEKGKYYAPKVFHMRDFNTEDILNLAISDDSEVIVRTANMLDDLIWEDGVSVKDFTDKEVEETVFTLYKTFYNPVMKGQSYTPTKKDMDFLAKQNGGTESADYKQIERDLKTGKWAPTFDIDLNTVKPYEVPEKVTKVATVTKPNGFSCKYSMPRYGDTIVLKEYVETYWADEDRKFEPITQMIKDEQDMKKRFRDGENINLLSIPRPTKEDKKRYDEYVMKRNAFSMTALRALHLVEYRGQDVSNLTLDQKYKMAQDPELDLPTFKKINEKFSNVKIGLPDKITILDPITNTMEEYEYSFRIPVILQAMGNNESDGTVIDFD